MRLLLCMACLGSAALALAAEPPPPPPGPPPCAPCTAKTCVAVPTTKKTDKVIYDDRCIDYCLPTCSLWSLFGGGCGCDAGCLNCGQPHARHVLIKKFVHEECHDVQCEVREAPCVPPSFPGR